MNIYKFIKIRGLEGYRTGYYVPKLYRLGGDLHVLHTYGMSYMKERLRGWTVWYVENEADYAQVIATLNQLKKTRAFDYKVFTM